MNPTFWIILISTALIVVALGLIYRRARTRERIFERLLETSQIKFDRQLSQFNIFLKSMPALQDLIRSSTTKESWKPLCLDELRALVRADGASFWRMLEADQKLMLDLHRGTESALHGKGEKVSFDEGEVGQAGKQRQTILSFFPNEGGGFRSVIAVPLVINGALWGVFRLVRDGEEKISQKEAEAVNVFAAQLTLSLENRDHIDNREKFYLELVQTLADTLDARDASKEGQTRQARRLARLTALELDMPEEFIYYLEFAALMHDIGKIAIDERLLKKPGKLTPAEFEEIKKHPELGAKILAPVTMLAPVAPMVLYHQEWYNGAGYPEGLRGEEIPLGARIVGILDAWGAMTSDHPWRHALTSAEAAKEIKKNSGTQFDPKVVEAFLTALEKQGIIS